MAQQCIASQIPFKEIFISPLKAGKDAEEEELKKNCIVIYFKVKHY